MAARTRKPPAPATAAPAAGDAPDFDALLRGLMESASNGSASRWSRVFAYLHDSRSGIATRPVANPLLIPLA